MLYPEIITLYFVIFVISFKVNAAFAETVKKYNAEIALMHFILFMFAFYPHIDNSIKCVFIAVMIVSFLFTLQQLGMSKTNYFNTILNKIRYYLEGKKLNV
jgi:Na+-transporting NADH:ubiquinone oxidoreductase subunit NqrB